MKKLTDISVLTLGLTLYGCSTLVSMAVMSLGFGVLLLSFAYFLIQRRKSLGSHYFSTYQSRGILSSSENKIFLWLSASLALACALSLFVAWMFPLTFAGRGAKTVSFQDILKAWYLFLPFFLGGLFTLIPEKNLRQVLRAWLLFAGLISIIGIVQFFTGWPRRQEIPFVPGYYHCSLFFGHHLSTASILIFPFFLMLSSSTSARRDSKDIFPSSIFLVLAGVTLTALFLTWSRTLWIALPLGIAAWFLRNLSKKRALGIFIALTLAPVSLSQVPQIRNRVQNAMGISERVELWKANFEFFKTRPLTGVGWRKPESLMSSYFEEKYPLDWRSRFVGHAHNNLLEMLSGTGILGTLLWLAWNLWVFRMAFLGSKSRTLRGDLSWGIFCAWIVLHLNGLTQVNFWEGKVLHQMMWVTGLLILFQTSRSGSKSFAE